jgi:hypothetical protein
MNFVLEVAANLNYNVFLKRHQLWKFAFDWKINMNIRNEIFSEIRKETALDEICILTREEIIVFRI